MNEQSQSAQKGEIEFRKRLVEKQTGGSDLLQGEYDTREIDDVLSLRMSHTREDINRLKQQGISVSPYLEIGAERCQRSLVMENDFHARGAAADISFDMLKSAHHYSGIFEKNKLPLRICCDAYLLPFLNNSLPFVFCYDTLHHFPDPAPIIDQIHRVLVPGGYLLVGEEPYRKLFKVKIYKTVVHPSSHGKKHGRIKTILDSFFADIIFNETGFGIIENHDISVKQWRRIFQIFDYVKIKLRSIRKVETNLDTKGLSIKKLIALIFGGNTQALCGKQGKTIPPPHNIEETLACPDCLEIKSECPLEKTTGAQFQCTRCGRTFPMIDGVLFLLTREQLSNLYPQFAG